MGGELATQGRQAVFDAGVIQIFRTIGSVEGTQELMQSTAPQQHRGRFCWTGAAHPTAHLSGAKVLVQQGRGTGRAGQGHFHGQPLFKAAAGICAQAQGPGGLTNPWRCKQGGFQPDVPGMCGHPTFETPHHTRDCHGTVMTGDDLNAAVEASLLIIQTNKGFPVASGTDGKTLGIHRLPGQLFQRIGIKGVEGLPLLQHHQIGDVHHRIHAVHTTALKPLLQPGR